MYRPAPYAVNDPDVLQHFIEDTGFGLLVTRTASGIVGSHLPFVVRRQPAGLVLETHMARANPGWRVLDGERALVVFSGPHAFIAGAWYGEDDAVPTWNYVAVHAYGSLTVLQDPAAVREVVGRMLARWEPDSPLRDRWDSPEVSAKLRAVVGVRIAVEELAGQWKLGQGHSIPGRRRVIAALRASGDAGNVACAAWMARTLDADHDQQRVGARPPV